MQPDAARLAPDRQRVVGPDGSKNRRNTRPERAMVLAGETGDREPRDDT